VRTITGPHPAVDLGRWGRHPILLERMRFLFACDPTKQDSVPCFPVSTKEAKVRRYAKNSHLKRDIASARIAGRTSQPDADEHWARPHIWRRHMRWRQCLDAAVIVFGFLSFISLVGYFLALHDIWHDFASPEVWARAGQALPEWYSSVNRCPLEWGMLQAGFCLMLIFHILLFGRRLVGSGRPL
jgi:hypothetical protein